MNHRWWFRERTVSSTGTTVQGKIGKGRQFNGGSDYVGLADPLGTSRNAFTIDAWVNPDSTQVDWARIMDKRNNSGSPGWVDYSLLYNNQGKVYCVVENATQEFNTVPQSVPANIWSHLACVYDGSTLKFYVNGSALASTSANGAVKSSAGNFAIGADGTGTSSFFRGSIDEARVSQVARTPSEIRQVYEISRRTHPITIDFVSSLNSGDLITGSSDLSFAVNDATKLYLGDKVIIKEQLEGVQFVAQATVNTKSTNTITVASWDTGSTFPSSGYSINATAIKWQKEYFDLGGISSEQRNAVTKITYKATSGVGANIWLDDIKTNLYLNDTAPNDFNTQTGIGTYTASIPQSRSQYFQYRAVLNSWDTNTSPSLNSARLDYINNTTPPAPSISSPANLATNVALNTTITMTTTDANSDYLQYKLLISTDPTFTQNLSTYDQSASQTGWSGQNASGNTAYNSGSTATYTPSVALEQGKTYYVRAYAIDPAGTNLWSSVGTSISFTTIPTSQTVTVSETTQTALTNATLNRVVDEGTSDVLPHLATPQHELPVDVNTIALWHMNETSGATIADSSGNVNTGTATGTTIVNSKSNFSKARSFNGINDYVAVPDSTSLRITNYTVEVWMNVPQQNEALKGIVGKVGRNYNIWLGNANGDMGYIRHRFHDAASTDSGCPDTGNVIAWNTWNYIVITNDGKYCRTYVNGKLEASGTIVGTGGLLYDNNVTYMGSDLDGAKSKFLKGTLDEVRISNIARTQDEILSNYQRYPYSVYTSKVFNLTNATNWGQFTWMAKGVRTADGETPASTSNLVTQWNFNETSGTTAVSGGSCGVSCNGTLTNMTTSGQDAVAGDGWTAANKRWGTGAVMFDGVDGYVNIPSSATLTLGANWTMGVWVNPSKYNASYNTIYSWIPGATAYFQLFLDGSGRVKTATSLEGEQTWTNLSVPAGQWSYIVVNTSSNIATVYINGVSAGSKTVTYPSGTTGAKIGWDTNAGRQFMGTMDAFTIYNRVLTLPEILSNYQAGNLEFQTRSGSDGTPDDGSGWEDWKPITNETQLLSLDSDAVNWTSSNSNMLTVSNDSVTKIEGTGS
ncbi:Ig-like domain-containing protein, partial [Candidatus Roizmanbacteria bacterium]|nr:Ig-like domain-containing protein [Candidatus Roizmanbacteria bacterium]